MELKVFLTAVLALTALSSGSIVKPPAENFKLLILHNNDMHARFEQTSQLSGACTTADREAGKCYGGFPRVAHVVKEARRQAQTGEGPPVLYLNAGDTYTGTAWFTIYKWKIAAEFVNALQPDAVSLGNNEVEEGSKVSPLLENINAPILATNVNIKSADMTNIQKSIIFDVNGVQVGVVGYLTPESDMLDSFGNIEYVDEVLALREEVEKLQALNVNIIIALGHSTRAKDIEIAREVAGLDIVITGNKNTFYWNGDTVPNAEDSLVVIQQSGKEVPVILSTAYNKYLGSLHVEFSADGEIVEYNDDRILLDSSVPQDVTSLDIMKKYNSELGSKSQEVLGDTAVELDAQSCHVEECNFGNFVADAMMYYYATRFEGGTWTDAAIAIIHSGAIGDSIAPANRPAAVTRGDLMAALPIESNLVAVTMNGVVLNQVLEHSIFDYRQENQTGQFLQFSGIRVTYDLEKAPGSRVVDVVARCWDCLIPEYYTIDDWRTYKVLMPAALAAGEFGYEMVVGLPKSELEYDEITCTSEYIKLRSPVYPEVAGRIVFYEHRAPDSATAISSSFCIVILLSVALNIYNH